MMGFDGIRKKVIIQESPGHPSDMFSFKKIPYFDFHSNSIFPQNPLFMPSRSVRGR